MKRLSHSEESKAARIFTDREEPRNAFWQQYHAAVADLPNENDDVRVVHYYGVGGIGKTALLKKLMEEMQEQLPKPLYAHYNFESGTDTRNVLRAIKAMLESKYKFDFILFNLGLYVYAQKRGEDAAAIEKKSLMDAHPLWQQVFSVAGNIPNLNIITQVLGTLDGIVAYASTLHELKKHENRIKRLSFLEADEVYQELPKLFVDDLRRNMEKVKQPLVIFLDTYERLVNEMAAVGEPLMNDLWLRDSSGPILNVPHVLWVIAGREKLKWDRFDPDWEEAIDGHRLGDLSEEDSVAFLQGAGIAEALARQLYRLTNGTPVYLDLCVDVYEALQRKGVAADVADFGGNNIELIERFMRYMDDTQKTLAYIAACMNQWDDEVFAAVAKELGVWNPTTYEKFKGYSFVDTLEDGRYVIHQTVRDVLVQSCPTALRQDIAAAMADYFAEYIEKQNLFSPTYPYALMGLVRAGILLHTDRDALAEFLIGKVEKPLQALFESGQFKESEAILALLQKEARKNEEDRLYVTILGCEGFFLGEKGLHNEALTLKQRVLEKSRHILGEDHPLTLLAMGNLAHTLGVLGRHNEALTLQQEVLEKCRRILGEDHPHTLLAMGNLAATLGELGRHNEALDLEQEVLEKRRRIQGEDHPHTLRAMNNLATTLGDLGRHDEALTLQQEVPEKSRRILGEDHPDTLRTMNNLAGTLGELGRHDEALTLQQEVLEKCRRILSEDHPDTLTAMNNLASTLGNLGRHNEALTLQQEVLEKSRRILGEGHPATLRAMGNLVCTLRDLRQYNKALPLCEDLLRKRRRVLGNHHPLTLATMRFLADILIRLGQRNKAQALMKELSKLRKNSGRK